MINSAVFRDKMGKDYLGADQRKAKTEKEGEEKEIKVQCSCAVIVLIRLLQKVKCNKSFSCNH